MCFAAPQPLLKASMTQGHCDGTFDFLLQAAVRTRLSHSETRDSLQVFSKQGTWAEAAASRRTPYPSAVMRPLKRNQLASRASCKKQDEGDKRNETVDSYQ